MLRGRISPEQHQGEAEENGAPPASGKVPRSPGALSAGAGNGQREDAPWDSPAAAGLPLEFPGRETCSPGGRAREQCGPHSFTEESGTHGSGAQPANSGRGFPRSHSGLTRATVPPASVSTVTGWLQLPAPLLIISLSGINIRI